MFYADKRVLVTGGSGFVGSHIVRELLQQGAKVRVPVHNRSQCVHDENVESITVDLMRLEDCYKVVKDIDYVVHAAGYVGSAGVKRFHVMEGITINLQLTTQMLQAAWKENVKGFVLFSSSTGYPAVDYPVKEEEMWNGPPHSSYIGYGWMRKYSEKLAEFVSLESGMKVAIVRPSSVYGAGDNFDLRTCHVIPALIRRAVEKENPYVVWGTGNEIRDCLHIVDFARGCLLVFEKCDSCDPINIAFGKGYTIKDMVEIILKAAGHEKSDVVFDSSKPTAIPIRMVSSAKAEKVLGFIPQISLEEGLKSTVDWYINNKVQ
jgi:GDP-L-fucose synthase|tara:strand:- start:4006 stop:4962 length:957 start_codon:yes stop_codon:yes gene_type:complete